MGHRVYLRFFGPVTFEVGNDGPAPLAGKKLQALLGYLAFEPREHSRDELAALLWGDMSDASSRHNLRQALSKLRRVLGGDAIAAGERVRLRMLQSDMRRALYHAERSVELNPNDDRCLAGLGEILSFVGSAEVAIDRLRHAMRLNPYHPESYWAHLARALFHMGAHGEALRRSARSRRRASATGSTLQRRRLRRATPPP